MVGEEAATLDRRHIPCGACHQQRRRPVAAAALMRTSLVSLCFVSVWVWVKCVRVWSCEIKSTATTRFLTSPLLPSEPHFACIIQKHTGRSTRPLSSPAFHFLPSADFPRYILPLPPSSLPPPTLLHRHRHATRYATTPPGRLLQRPGLPMHRPPSLPRSVPVPHAHEPDSAVHGLVAFFPGGVPRVRGSEEARQPPEGGRGGWK